MKEIDFRYDLLPLKNKLFRLALRITMDTAEAEDVTEDTLIRLWEKRDALAAVDSVEAYALTVCRNLSLDRCRSSEKACLSLTACLQSRLTTATVLPTNSWRRPTAWNG